MGWLPEGGRRKAGAGPGMEGELPPGVSERRACSLARHCVRGSADDPKVWLAKKVCQVRLSRESREPPAPGLPRASRTMLLGRCWLEPIFFRLPSGACLSGWAGSEAGLGCHRVPTITWRSGNPISLQKRGRSHGSHGSHPECLQTPVLSWCASSSQHGIRVLEVDGITMGLLAIQTGPA